MDERTELDDALITDCLRAMHREPGQVQSWHRIDHGASGSGVFRLELTGAAPPEAVLKVTTTTAEALDDSRRELRFYADLADQLPVTTPHVLGMAENDEWICLLLSAARQAPSPETWTSETWAAIAAQLGGLHHRTVAANASGLSWLASVWEPEPAAASKENALSYWGSVGCADLVHRLLDSSELRRPATALPRCVAHGDFHADNLLVDERDQFVFADWQGVGFGPGSDDLAMLWQRAEAVGAHPPRDAMLEPYARARGLPVDEVLRQAVVAAELLLLLFGWPAHLADAPPTQQAIMTRRLRLLYDEWTADGRG